MAYRSGFRRTVLYYYLATPVFLLVDYFFGQNIRLAALEAYPAVKYFYYAVCCLSAVWMVRSELWADLFALVESFSNILLLVLGVLTPYFQAIQAAQSGQVLPGLTPAWVLNFILASSVAVVVFYGNRLIRGSGGMSQNLPRG